MLEGRFTFDGHAIVEGETEQKAIAKFNERF